MGVNHKKLVLASHHIVYAARADEDSTKGVNLCV